MIDEHAREVSFWDASKHSTWTDEKAARRPIQENGMAVMPSSIIVEDTSLLTICGGVPGDKMTGCRTGVNMAGDCVYDAVCRGQRVVEIGP
jgi:hypothetical protein